MKIIKQGERPEDKLRWNFKCEHCKCEFQCTTQEVAPFVDIFKAQIKKECPHCNNWVECTREEVLRNIEIYEILLSVKDDVVNPEK